MRNSLFRSFLLLPISAVLAFTLNGCDTTSTTVVSQTVDNIVWLPDESGMLAFIDKVYENVDGSESDGQNLYQVNTGGSIGNGLFPSDAASNNPPYWNAPIVYISSDGKTAITQYGTDIYSIPTSGGSGSDLIQQTQLWGISPDGKYAVTNQTAANNAANILTTYNLTNNPITLDPRTTVRGLISNRALWLNNDQYALTIDDSTDALGLHEHVTIYNAQGDSVMSIPNGDVSFSAGGFASVTNDLFVRTYSFGINRINLTTLKLDTIVSTDSVESMDVSNDGTVLVYTSSETTVNLPLYAVNLANDHISQSLATGISKPVLSPNKDKAACINSGGNIQVVGVTTPP
jgi:hypothetical protein